MISAPIVCSALCILIFCSFESPVLANSVKSNTAWSKQKWETEIIGGARGRLFAQLLQQRNLIGLSQQKLERIIGKPDNDGLYRLSRFCTGGIVLRVEYKKRHLQRWRLESWGANGNATLIPEPWVETNVVFNREDGGFIPLDVVPKSTKTLSNSKNLHS